jgi:hypothetical protein
VVARAVDLAKRPLSLERLLIALDLAVDLRAAVGDQQVADSALADKLRERVVVGVGPGVVADEPLRLDPVLGEDGEPALDKAGHRGRPFVAVELAVGVARVVVDERVHPFVADVHAQLGAGAVSVAGDGVTGPAETNEAFAVDVQEVAGAGPLVAARLLARRLRRP